MTDRVAPPEFTDAEIIDAIAESARLHGWEAEPRPELARANFDAELAGAFTPDELPDATTIERIWLNELDRQRPLIAAYTPEPTRDDDPDAWDLALRDLYFAITPIEDLVKRAEELGIPEDDRLRQATMAKYSIRHPGPAESASGLLDDLVAYLKRFLVLPDEHAYIACALWIAHTRIFERGAMTPRLLFTSPEPGSGKTLSLDIVGSLTERPVLAQSMTPSVLARMNNDAKGQPSYFFDELDTAFPAKGVTESSEGLRSIIGGGAYPNGNYIRSVRREGEFENDEMSTFAPMALAGLHLPPQTIVDRSIVIRMRRKLRAEHVEIYRVRDTEAERDDLKARLAEWATSTHAALHGRWPDMPDELDNRAAQVWELLVAIADDAGGAWPQLARDAAVFFVTDTRYKPVSIAIRLLTDIRKAFGDADRITSAELLDRLKRVDDNPWTDLGGTGLFTKDIRKILEEFDIPPVHTIRIPGAESLGTQSGWKRSDFHDAFIRYPENTLATSTEMDIES